MLRAAIPPPLHAVHVPTEPLAHTPQPRQDFDPRHQTRHPDHRDLHCTTADAMAWARVADAGKAAAEATFDSLAPAEEAGWQARAHLRADGGADGTRSRSGWRTGTASSSSGGSGSSSGSSSCNKGGGRSSSSTASSRYRATRGSAALRHCLLHTGAGSSISESSSSSSSSSSSD